MKSKYKIRLFRWFLFLWMSFIYLWGLYLALIAVAVGVVQVTGANRHSGQSGRKWDRRPAR